MRVGSLSDARVAKFVRRHFAAAFEKVGTFTIVKCGQRVVQKQGGNVAAYFCTPEGDVIHAVAGVVDARTFLAEARWAVRLYERAAKEAGGDLGKLVKAIRDAHASRSREPQDVCDDSVALSDMCTLRTIGTLTEVDFRACKERTESIGLLVEALKSSKTQAKLVDGVRHVSVIQLQALKRPSTGADILWLKGRQASNSISISSSYVDTHLLTSRCYVILSPSRQVHDLLSTQAMKPIHEIYKTVFQSILGQEVSSEDVKQVELKEPK